MLKIKVKDVEYKIKFGYKAIAKSNVLKDIVALRKKFSTNPKDEDDTDQNENEDNTDQGEDNTDQIKEEDNTEKYIEMIDEILDLTSRLLLAGLQKYHSDVFGYDPDDPESVKNAKDIIENFIDDYIDEEDSMELMDLFTALQDELMNNGFLFGKSQKAEEAMTEQDATIAPQDHKKKQSN